MSHKFSFWIILLLGVVQVHMWSIPGWQKNENTWNFSIGPCERKSIHFHPKCQVKKKVLSKLGFIIFKWEKYTKKSMERHVTFFWFQKSNGRFGFLEKHRFQPTCVFHTSREPWRLRPYSRPSQAPVIKAGRGTRFFPRPWSHCHFEFLRLLIIQVRNLASYK